MKITVPPPFQDCEALLLQLETNLRAAVAQLPPGSIEPEELEKQIGDLHKIALTAYLGGFLGGIEYSNRESGRNAKSLLINATSAASALVDAQQQEKT